MESNFIVFDFSGEYICVKYSCTGDVVTKDDIEDCALSYYDHASYEGLSYAEKVADIMGSFPGIKYEIINPVIYME